ncbi:MAG: hypothetical protein MJA83_00125, partial [Gammaproteobacteria bacterium]|nr:hypothetical protein [Gammaproteobacteria bacterium]
MSKLGIKIWKYTAAVFAAVVIILALGIGVFRIVAPMVPEYREDAEQWASETIGLPVSIENMDLRWAILGPEVVLTDVRLLAPEDKRELLSAAVVRIGVNPVELLFAGSIKPSRIIIQNPRLVLSRYRDGNLYLSGRLLQFTSDAVQADPDAWRGVLTTLLANGRIVVRDGELLWQDMLWQTQWSFTDVDIALKSEGDTHAIEGDFALPEELGRAIAVELQAAGPSDRPEDWQWTAELAVRDARSEWFYKRWAPHPEGYLEGDVGAELNISGTGFSPAAINGAVNLRGLTFRDLQPTLSDIDQAGHVINEIQADIEWQRLETGWSLAWEDFDFTYAESAWPVSSGAFTYSAGTESVKDIEFKAGFLRLQDLHLIAGWMTTDIFGHRDQLQLLSPRGDVRDVIFSARIDGKELTGFEISAAANDIAINSYGKIPGIRGINATVKGDQDNGVLQVEAEDLALDFGSLFRGPLFVDDVKSDAAWARTEEGLAFSVSNIEFGGSDLQAGGAQLELLIPSSGDSPSIDMQAWLRGGRGESKSTYLPVGIMSEPLINWLDESIVTADIPEANLTLRGKLSDFPYADESGLFEVSFHADNGILDYASGWPRIEGLAADITFRNVSMNITATGGTIVGAPIGHTTARIEDLTDAILEVEGAAASSAEQVLSFLKNSPLEDRFGAYLDSARTSGELNVDVSLELPIENLDDARVDGVAHAAGVSLGHEVLPQDFVAVNGDVTFTKSLIKAEQMTAQFAGVPIEIAVRPARADDRLKSLDNTVVELEGRSPLSDLLAEFDIQIDKYLKGETPWRGLAIFPNTPDAPDTNFEFHLDTDLRGTAIELPEPVGKPRSTAVSTRLSVSIPDLDHIDVGLRYGRSMETLFKYVKQRDQMTLYGGHVVFGNAARPQIDIPGLVMS